VPWSHDPPRGAQGEKAFEDTSCERRRAGELSKLEHSALIHSRQAQAYEQARSELRKADNWPRQSRSHGDAVAGLI
jgi:hypothetical protein